MGFGRRRMDLEPEEIEGLLIYQIGAIEAMARAHGTILRHVKPHGWLYNEAVRNLELARVIARAVRKVSPRLVMFGLSGSFLIRAAEEEGLPFAREAFVDRAYLENGTLAPRSRPGALITNPDRAAYQVLRIAQGKEVTCLQSGEIKLAADTVCIHGDTPGAIRILTEVRKVLGQHKIQISTFEPT
jgi:5-oxoprolinase (ATP-hydrolysing) subunit A